MRLWWELTDHRETADQYLRWGLTVCRGIFQIGGGIVGDQMVLRVIAGVYMRLLYTKDQAAQ